MHKGFNVYKKVQQWIENTDNIMCLRLVTDGYIAWTLFIAIHHTQEDLDVS
jgi:hypothetical protein